MTETVSSYDVRAELEDRLERDLLGPWDGPEEELEHGRPPADRYLLGRLVPVDGPSAAPVDAESDTDVEKGFAGPTAEVEDDPQLTDAGGAEIAGGDEPPAPSATVRSGSMAASAIGLSFHVPVDIDVVTVTASWGRYEQVLSERQVTDSGRPALVWKRFPAGGEPVEIRLDGSRADDHRDIPDPGQEHVVLRALVRQRDGRRYVSVSLVNEQRAEQGSAVDRTRLYQVQLQVTALDGHAAIFLGHNDPLLDEPRRPGGHDPDGSNLELLYRGVRQYAVGRQCAVDPAVRPGETRAWQLTTTCFPAADVLLTVPADAADLPGIELDMSRLGSADHDGSSLVRVLRPLVVRYRAWLGTERERADVDEEVQRHRAAAQANLDTADEVAARLERAIELLRTNGIAREAFRFANQAMHIQRLRSEVTRARGGDPDASVDQLLHTFKDPKNYSWRPFQLAFVLLCLPGLTDPAHPDAHRGPDDAEVELLFFPTGGGKTEAYLGLAAYTFAIRRLQGVVGTGSDARDGTEGVAVLMRYTLRLLTAQQFARASALMCACESLRRERLAAGDMRWGTTPFRIGLWVGNSVTPGRYEDAKDQVADLTSETQQLGGPLQLAACPWCGHPLAGDCLETDDLRRRVLLYCGDPDGRCLFSRRQSPGEGLPVLTVDEEIYRLAPALVISTVDKLAQMPWYDRVATLFGGVDRRCSRHGWKPPEYGSFCKDSHPARGQLPAASTETVMRPRPPDLIIQDELHLISDALGSLVGLYETAVDLLCTRRDAGHVIRPAVVASTATVRRAKDQVKQVFDRGLSIFPPPVLDAGATFFSRTAPESPKTPSRRYRGILASGARMGAIQIRVASAVMEHAQYLFDKHGMPADPYMTLVDYFTSTRDLANMHRLVEDDIADRLRSDRAVHTRRRRPNVAELTSRMPSNRIASTLAELDRVFDPAFDSTAAAEGRRQRRRDKEELPTRTAMPPPDVLLATSMLQVGVDVQRLGLMMVTGQPKNTAEYIQATSRVGRSTARPGLVLTVYQWSRPRDLGHYETFRFGHSVFGARVEGLTTTPFSERAIDRGLTAVLVAAIRHSSPGHLENTRAGAVPLDGPEVDRLIDHIAARAGRVVHETAAEEAIRQELRHRLDQWTSIRHHLESGRLGYGAGTDVDALLRGPDAAGWDWRHAPLSLREVEVGTALQLDRDDTSMQDPPTWSWAAPAAPAGA